MHLAQLRSGLTRSPRFFLPALAFGLSACVPLTREEAEEVLSEIEFYGQATTMLGNAIELTADFTIGGAVEDSISNLYDFAESQLPCANVMFESLGGSTLVEIHYGAGDGICEHEGRRYSGSQRINITQQDATTISVHHRWTAFENGSIEANGETTVTWEIGSPGSRTVKHDISFERQADGRDAHTQGERVQTPLEGDLSLGIVVAGSASWIGLSGEYLLDIQDVEMRWRDPIPQAGSYFLETPFDKSATLSFERTAPTRVQVTAASAGREYTNERVTPE